MFLVCGVLSFRARKGEVAVDAGFLLFAVLCLLFLWLLLIQSPGRGCSPPRPSYMCRTEAARMQGLDPPLRATTGLYSAHVRREFVRVPSRCRSWYSSYGRVSAGDCRLKIWTPRPIG